MPRCARIRLAGVPLHVIQRGNNRNPCFFEPADYRFYLSQLHELTRRFECAVHAYVLMTNHVHLLLTPAEATGASLLMKHLGQRYVQYVNRVYARTGTLWDGRFRSHPVQSGRYLLACYRYIELNPVRAGIVHEPAGYPWSSYRENAGDTASSLLTPHAAYCELGGPAQYRKIFPARVAALELARIRSAATSSLPLGDKHFRDQIARSVGRRLEPGVAGRPRQENPGLSRISAENRVCPVLWAKSGSVPGFSRP